MTFTWRLISISCLFLLAISGFQAACATPTTTAFETVAPGLEFRQVQLSTPRPITIWQLRCDPKRVRFSLLLASDTKGKSELARADKIAKAFSQSAVINCSYFDGNDQVLGYHERLGHTLNPDISEGGVFGGFFYWDGARAGLKARGDSLPSHVPVLFQAGPRLVWDGEPISGLEKTALAARSGVAIDREGRVILFALGPVAMCSLAELPEILRRPVNQGGVAAWRALNFDGGSSTQFYVDSGHKRAYLPGRAPVPAFLGVQSK